MMFVIFSLLIELTTLVINSFVPKIITQVLYSIVLVADNMNNIRLQGILVLDCMWRYNYDLWISI
jgi:hypothetical protein